MKTDYVPLKENVSIVGLAQSGKTNLACFIAMNLIKSGHNVIIEDNRNRFTRLNPLCVKNSFDRLGTQNLEILQLRWTNEVFETLCGKVMSLHEEVFIMDELHNFCSKNRAETNLAMLVRNCNNENIGYIAIFQRPQEVPSMVLSNSHHIYAFPLELPSDIDYMCTWLGDDFRKFNESEIPKYTCLHKTQGIRGTDFVKAPRLI